MRRSPLRLVMGFLVGALLATQAGAAGAQIPDPTNVQVPNPTETVPPAVQEAIDAVTEDVSEAADTATPAAIERLPAMSNRFTPMDLSVPWISVRRWHHE
jgi:hypothetical protein